MEDEICGVMEKLKLLKTQGLVGNINGLSATVIQLNDQILKWKLLVIQVLDKRGFM